MHRQNCAGLHQNNREAKNMSQQAMRFLCEACLGANGQRVRREKQASVADIGADGEAADDADKDD